MTGHTPGPWTFHRGDRYIESALPDLTGTHEHICDLRADLAGNLHTANANLIAAAPDMLSALKYVQDDYRELLRQGPNDDEAAEIDAALQIIGAAIAKAEGVA